MSTDPVVTMIGRAERRMVADRLERGALNAASLAGHTTALGMQAFATRWLAEQFATYKANVAAARAGAAVPPAKWQDAP